MKNFRKFALIILTSITLVFTGCSSSKNIISTTDTIYKTNTEYVNKFIHDSIYIHDSIIKETKGDTLFVEKYKDRYIYKQLYDTLYTTDTIVKTMEVTIEKPIKDTTYRNLFFITISLLLMIGLFRYLNKKV